MRKHALFICLTLTALYLPTGKSGAELSPNDLGKISYDQHIGQPISPDLGFRESAGHAIVLGDLFNSKPTLLVLGYYHCPMLCTLINDGLIEALQELRFDVGRDFNIINVSIDPQETSKAAAVKKVEYLKRYGRPGAAEGWHFLTGRRETIAQVAREAGFRFRYDSATNEFAHPSGFIVLTPSGKISRYFFGVNFDPKELQRAIIAASKGKRGSVIHELVLLCSHYNPITGKYGALVLQLLRVLGVVTVLAMGWWIFSMARRGPKEAA